MGGRPERVTLTSKRQITLPAAVCRQLGLGKGDQLELDFVDHEIHLRRVPRFPPLTRKSELFGLLGVGGRPDAEPFEDHDAAIVAEAACDAAE